jgi:hypothetical protein
LFRKGGAVLYTAKEKEAITELCRDSDVAVLLKAGDAIAAMLIDFVQVRIYVYTLSDSAMHMHMQ